MSLQPTIEPYVPARQSYWQLGCNDAKAGRGPNPPEKRRYPDLSLCFHQPEYDSYMNGFDAGKKSPNVLAKYQQEEA